MERINLFAVATLLMTSVLLSGTEFSHAGILVDADLPFNAELLDVYDPNENDDNVSPSLEELLGLAESEGEADVNFNWLAMIKVYETTDPIDIPFYVENSGGTTEYLIIEAIANLTDQDWTDYHAELGILDGDEFLSLREADALDLGLDFDTPDKDPDPYSFFVTNFDPFTVSPIFSTVIHEEDAISWEDGIIPALDGSFDFEDAAWLTFSVDIPDIEDSEYQFVLRQYPTFSEERQPVIPEPATMALLGSGLMGFAGLHRKKLKKRNY